MHNTYLPLENTVHQNKTTKQLNQKQISVLHLIFPHIYCDQLTTETSRFQICEKNRIMLLSPEIIIPVTSQFYGPILSSDPPPSHSHPIPTLQDAAESSPLQSWLQNHGMFLCGCTGEVRTGMWFKTPTCCGPGASRTARYT